MAKKKRQDGDQIIIKKYANRRLYDTNSSSYVTLDDLAKMVKDDRLFVVIDAKSGDDITHAVLSQIIFDEESKGETLLPTNFLRQLIAFYGDGLQQVVPGYLENSMAAFTQNQEKFRNFMEENMAATGVPPQSFKPFEEMAKQNIAIFEKTMSMFSPFGNSSDAAKGEEGEPDYKTDQAPDIRSDNGQLSDLQAQLAAMQAQINRLQKK